MKKENTNQNLIKKTKNTKKKSKNFVYGFAKKPKHLYEYNDLYAETGGGQ